MRSLWADLKRRGVLPRPTHLIPHPMAVRTICLKMGALRVEDLKMATRKAKVQKETVPTIAILEAAALGIAGLNVILPLNHNIKANNFY
jgi:hypothetical protein